LGEKCALEEDNSFSLHSVLAKRWNHILKQGLESSERNEIVEKCPLPANVSVKAPNLNDEITPAISAFQLKRDQHYADRQELLGKGIALVGKALNFLLCNEKIDKENKNILITNLGDAGKILTDVHHNISLGRKAGISPLFEKNVKDLLLKSKIEGGFLFGIDLAEKLKAAKVIEKTAKDLKQQKNTISGNAHKRTNKPLNYKAPSRYQKREFRQKGQYFW